MDYNANFFAFYMQFFLRFVIVFSLNIYSLSVIQMNFYRI